jgi:hypothetical protein
MKESKKIRNRVQTEIPSSPPTLNSRGESRPTQVHTPTLITPSKLNQEEDYLNTNKERSHRASRRQLSFHQMEERENAEEEVATSSVTTDNTSYFGGRNSSTSDNCQTNTRRVYTLINKMTGSIGGNGTCSMY